MNDVRPEMVRLLMRSTVTSKPYRKNDTEHHREQIPSMPKSFQSHVKNVTEVMKDLGNPFADASTDLYSLETKQIMSETVLEAVESA